MSLASSRQSFLFNVLTSYSHGPRDKPIRPVNPISCKQPSDDIQDSSRRNENRVAKLAMVALAAGVLTLGSVDDAFAAKTGGRVGGQTFKSSAPRSSGPRSNNSRTNIYITPPVAPPLVGGYGYGYGVPYYGGLGWSPFSFFAPGPSIAIGIGGGFETLALFVFLGAVATVVRRFASPRDEEDDYCPQMTCPTGNQRVVCNFVYSCLHLMATESRRSYGSDSSKLYMSDMNCDFPSNDR